jgi:DNA topoisomerase VI subunit A
MATKKPEEKSKPKSAVVAKESLKPILDATRAVYDDIQKIESPEIAMPLRSLQNVEFDPKVGYFELQGKMKGRKLTASTIKTFAQTLHLLSFAKELAVTNDEATKREAYYISKNWGDAKFNEQPESDTVMDDIEAMLMINREIIGFIPEEKGGAVAGKLVVVDKDNETGETIRIDCTKFGSGAYSIPSKVEDLKFETDAKFILAIETSGMFQRLAKQNYWRKTNSILVAMGGVPTRATRRFIRRLADEKKLPVYVFTDGDPYGFLNIYRTLKVGSGNAAHINKYFCVPQANFIGVTPQDIIDYKLPTHPLKDIDVKRVKDGMKNDPFVKQFKQWEDALNQMVKMKVRAEQQALAKWGLNFVIDKYLPDKLANHKTWLP